MSEKVMNNKDLRNIILSYFRTKAEIECCSCKKPCVFNKKVINRYVEIPTLDYTVIFYQCLECHWSMQTRDILGL